MLLTNQASFAYFRRVSRHGAIPTKRQCHRPQWLQEDGCYLDRSDDSCPLNHTYDCNSFYFGLAGPAPHSRSKETCKVGEVSYMLSTKFNINRGYKSLCEYEVVCSANSRQIPSTYWNAILTNDTACKAKEVGGLCEPINHELKVMYDLGCDSNVGQHRYRLETVTAVVGYVCVL